MQKAPVFTPGWPLYAVIAHVFTWSISTLLILASIAGYAGIVGGITVISLIGMTILSGFALSLSAVFSGRLYIGNQLFSRKPLLGVPARLAGIFLTGLFAFIAYFFYGLMLLGS